jgi:hypothetical protein
MINKVKFLVLALFIGTDGYSQDSTVSDPDPIRFQSEIDQFINKSQNSDLVKMELSPLLC